MTNIKTLIESVRAYISGFNKIHIYKKESIMDSVESKYLEKRVYIQELQQNNIVNGRLTVSVPNTIIDKISEILLISE